MQEKNNNIFDLLSNKSGTVFDYAKKHETPFLGFDKVKHIFIQYIYQGSEPVVSEPLFFIRIKFSKFWLLTDVGIEQFSKIQRLYHIMLRFINKCKVRRFKVYDVDEDLCLMPFTSIDPRKIMRILHNKCIYKFNIHDLINIINTSLTNQHFMIPNPCIPKNPYTNLAFSRHHIINIFLRMWELKIKMRPILYYFYQCNFSIEQFKNRHRVLLCDIAIDSNLSKETLANPDVIIDVLNLIQMYSNPFMQINLHPCFPSKLLYRIFRPYMKLYYKMKLFNCPVIEEKLRHGLCCFALFNPHFGRKYIRRDLSSGFDDRHLEYGDFTEGAFYELRNMSVFEIIKKYRKDSRNIFSISIEPLKRINYVFGETIIHYPVLHVEEDIEEDEEEIEVNNRDEEDGDAEEDW